WDPVDGADSYQVTIKRVSTGKALADYDELNVGDVTSLLVENVPISFWTNEVEVYVRAVKGIPCSDVSNIVRFVPKSLPKGDNAVDGVGEDQAVISGGVGCIVAPDSAQVFDMAGKSLSKEGLAPGVYIVLYGGRSQKVLVR
ncbi:MAG: hypothetical protein K2H22_09135, partial [Muribaculaceae bacterium]|nr:hypothetical protein [Muribaculaceae bacterium]